MIDNKIGFIGLGNVGYKLANNILKNGFKLYIFDLNKNLANKLINKGAIWADSVSELISNTTVFITCLPSPNSINLVIEQAIPFLSSKHLWIEMSTTDESEIIRLSKLCKKYGTNTLEAPITGGQHRAETGNIGILVGGERKYFDRAFHILSLVGHKIVYCGKIGNASTLKVVTNYLASINLFSFRRSFYGL